MDDKKFNKYLGQRIVLIKKILAEKNKEYTTDNKDRMHNFRRSGEMQRVTPEKALQGMASKQFVSVFDIIDTVEKENQKMGLAFVARPKEVTEKLIREKVGDAINYLILLEALLKERYNL